MENYPDFHEIRLRILNSLILLHMHNNSLQDARKLLQFSLNYIATSLQTLGNSHPSTSMLRQYLDAFRFQLIQVCFQLKMFEDSIAEIGHFDERSGEVWIVAQITLLQIFMILKPHEFESIKILSQTIRERILELAPGDHSDIMYWKSKPSILHHICRFWVIITLYIISTGNVDFYQPEASFNEFRRYFSVLKIVKRTATSSNSTGTSASLSSEPAPSPESSDITLSFDEFLSVEEMIILDLVMDQYLKRMRGLKNPSEITKGYKIASKYLEKQIAKTSQTCVEGVRTDFFTEQKLRRLRSLSILLQYNIATYFLFDGHLSSASNAIVSILDTLEKDVHLFSQFHIQTHLLIGLYFIQQQSSKNAIEHLELVEKCRQLNDPFALAWAKIFSMIAHLNAYQNDSSPVQSQKKSQSNLDYPNYSRKFIDIPEKTRLDLFRTLDSIETEDIFKWPAFRSITLFIKGTLYLSTGAIEDAIQNLREANFIVRETENDELRSQIDLQLSIGFSLLNNTSQSNRFMSHALNLAVRGKAYYIILLAHKIQEAYSIPVELWKEEKFLEIQKFLSSEREKCRTNDERIRKWLPQSNDTYFGLREMMNVNSKRNENI